MDPNDLVPEGVTLRDFDDYGALRNSVFETAKNSFASKFPHEYGKYRMEVEDLDYMEKDDYDLAHQKQALMTNQFLAKRLRGTLKLYDKESGKLLDSQKKVLMRVPYITDRGTTIHNGNEYVTLNQARLSSGIYTRQKSTGEIEAQVNAKRGTGKSYKVRLEPESSLYKLDIDQASLRLYSLLRDIGVSDDEMEKRWGPEVLQRNAAKYDPRTLDKAYKKLVRRPSPDASREEKVAAIKEALGMTVVSRGVVQRTLPNLFNQKAANIWRKAAYAGAGAVDHAAQNQDEFVKWHEKLQQQEQKARQKQEQAQMKREVETRKQVLEIAGINSDIVAEDGSVDPLAVIKQVLQNIQKEKKTRKDINTKKLVDQIKHQGEKKVEKMKAEGGIQDQLNRIDTEAEQQRVEAERDRVLSQVQQVLPQQQIPQQPPVQELMPKMASYELDKLLEAKSESDQRNYQAKHDLMRSLMWQHPQDFFIDSKKDGIYGVTHRPTNFRIHVPLHVAADLDIEDQSDADLMSRSRSILGLDKAATSVGTAVTDEGQQIDVNRLQELVADRGTERIYIQSLNVDDLNRSKSTGFGSRRYEAADMKLPILVDSDNKLVDIDSRHRYFKAVDEGRVYLPGVRVTQEDISKSYTDNNTPDFSKATTVSI